MPNDAPRRRLTIADLPVNPRLADPPPPPRPLKPHAAATAPPRPVQPPAALKAAAKPPTPPATAYVPAAVSYDADRFPCGWCFERRSWGFHRSLWRVHGIRLDVGDYTGIVRQCARGSAAPLGRATSGASPCAAAEPSWSRVAAPIR